MKTFHLLRVNSIAIIGRNQHQERVQLNTTLTRTPQSRDEQQQALSQVIAIGKRKRKPFLVHAAVVEAVDALDGSEQLIRNRDGGWSSSVSWMQGVMKPAPINTGDVLTDGVQSWLVTPVDLQLLNGELHNEVTAFLDQDVVQESVMVR